MGRSELLLRRMRIDLFRPLQFPDLICCLVTSNCAALVLGKQMRRRELIAGIVDSITPWPLVGRAQQPTGPVISFFHPRSGTDSERPLGPLRTLPAGVSAP